MKLTNAYVIISSEESHRVVSSSSYNFGTSQRSQSSVFNSNVGNKSNVQRPQTSGNISRPSNVTRPSTSENKRPTSGPPLISKLISLIKENSGNTVGKGVDANMAVNVIDISNFGIKVSHPNGTEALITKVENMIAYLSAELKNSDKFSSRSEKCVLVGYSGFQKG
ncbi:hypothetical protein Tco_1470802, partial [Tanacetum coccineum]